MSAWISTHRTATAAATVGVVAVLGFGLYWFSPQSALVDRRVDESLPSVAPPDATAGEGSGLGEVGGASDPYVLSSGSFRGIEHETSGRVSLVRVDGALVLRFEDLSTLNGPDLRVYLSPAPADADPAAFGEQPLDLGALKGNLGNQNYELPGTADPDDYASAVIWCRRFAVGFGVAPLDPATASP